MIKKYLNKAKSLKPKLITETVNCEAGKISMKEGDYVVLDFGDHYVGEVSLTVTYAGSPPDAPAFLKLKFCEHASELEENTSVYRGWISRSWIQEEYIHIDEIPSVFRMRRRYAFRYIRVDVLGLSSKYQLVIEKASVDAQTSATGDPALCGRTEREKKIDRIALRTLKNCMQTEFEDGPKRDRRLWLGDLRLQALCNYETYKNYDLVKRCLYLFAGTSGRNGEIYACVFTRPRVIADDTFMFDYSLLFTAVLCDYFKATGDSETASELLPNALRQIELARSQFKDDVICDCERLGWCFIDWSLELNKQCAAQAVYIYCEKQAIELCRLLGKETVDLENDVTRKAEAAKKAFFDESIGLFVSGNGRQVSYASNIWMCLAGVPDPEGCREILSRLPKTDAVRPVTPYLYHYYLQSLVDCGNVLMAESVMNDYWGGMAELGADTFWELYDPEDPDASPYGSRTVNSYCHAWSCTPSYFLRRYFRNGSGIKGVIFDLDGVLLSTDEYHFLAWKKLADRLGIPFDRQKNNFLRGVSRMESLEMILDGRDFSDEEKAAFAAEKNETYRSLLSEMTPGDVSDDTRKVIADLRSRGIRVAVGSSSKNTKFILERVGLLNDFDAIADGNDITRSKPDPEVFLLAATRLSLDPSECMVVEDAFAGIDSAAAGGFLPVAIGDAVRHPGSKIKIGRLPELLEYI